MNFICMQNEIKFQNSIKVKWFRYKTNNFFPSGFFISKAYN